MGGASSPLSSSAGASSTSCAGGGGAGEASGALEAVLDRIADYLEDQVRLNNRVLSILTYPLFMLLFAVVVVGVMVTLVLPQITELLLAQDLELPWYTVMVIGSSDFLRGYWWLLILLGIAIGYGYLPNATRCLGRLADCCDHPASAVNRVVAT